MPWTIKIYYIIKLSIELWLWFNMRLCYDWSSARNGFVYFALFDRYYCLWNSILNHYSEPLFVFLKIVCFPSSICFTVTKMWQKMGHIARRSLRNLTKCCTININNNFIYFVKLRGTQRETHSSLMTNHSIASYWIIATAQ